MTYTEVTPQEQLPYRNSMEFPRNFQHFSLERDFSTTRASSLSVQRREVRCAFNGTNYKSLSASISQEHISAHVTVLEPSVCRIVSKMSVTREGAFPQEERDAIAGENYYCYSERLVSEVIDFFQLPSNARIIDLAAGVGAMTHDILNKLPYARVTGIDPHVRKTPVFTTFQHRLNSADFYHLSTTAEATGLDRASVDFVVCGQAFSLLKFIETREEVRRILKPGCGAALFFIHGANRAYTGLEEFLFEIQLPEPPTPFMREFWALIKEHFHLPLETRREFHWTDEKDPDTTAYQQLIRTTEVMRSFFHNGECRIKTVFEQWGLYSFTDLYSLCRWTQDEQDQDLQESSRRYRDFMMQRERRIQEGLRDIFNRYQVDGKVPFYHFVTVFYGQMSKARAV